jgi:nucleoside-diphosphate-sugar epimerase
VIKIAITGSNGFVGRNLVARILKTDNFHLRLLSRNQTGIFASSSNVEYVKCDFIGSSIESLKRCVEGCSIVINCAGELHNQSLMNEINFIGAMNLAEASIPTVEKFIQLSSTGVYGVTGGEPFNFSSKKIYIDEDFKLNPENKYELSKALADNHLKQIAKSTKAKIIIARPSVVFGNDMSGQSLFGLISQIKSKKFFYIGSRDAITNYVHVDDLSNALMGLIDANDISQYEEYIISETLSLEELVQVISRELKVNGEHLVIPRSFALFIAKLSYIFPRFPLTRSRINAMTGNVVFDSSKLRNTTGWSPQLGVRTGFANLVRCWIAKNAN